MAGNRIIDVEKQTAILFGEILNEHGIDFSIMGFYSKTRNHSSYITLKGFDEKWDLGKLKLGSPEPVSYTHLDVYKRQVLACQFVPDLAVFAAGNGVGPFAVFRAPMAHADLFHHPARGRVHRHRRRDDPVVAAGRKAPIDECRGAFRGEPLAPFRPAQAISEFGKGLALRPQACLLYTSRCV